MLRLQAETIVVFFDNMRVWKKKSGDLNTYDVTVSLATGNLYSSFTYYWYTGANEWYLSGILFQDFKKKNV